MIFRYRYPVSLTTILSTVILLTNIGCADQNTAVPSKDKLEEWYQKGDSLYEKEDYTNAIIWFRKAAEQGHTASQNAMGFSYRDGEGVKQDFVKAMMWFRRAAEQGHGTGQTNLAWMYFQGQDVKQDNNQAVFWYRKAAEQGHSGGQSQLGWMYHNGLGVKKDPAKAATWYRKSAEQGYIAGQINYRQNVRRGNRA